MHCRFIQQFLWKSVCGSIFQGNAATCNKLYLKWQILLRVCGQIISVCNSERIIKIGHLFAKIMLKWKRIQFFWLSLVYISYQCCWHCVQATVVYNLATYGIDPEYFASTVQKGIACSVTVGPRPAKPKEIQVMVQGNQINYIGQLLRGDLITLC